MPNILIISAHGEIAMTLARTLLQSGTHTIWCNVGSAGSSARNARILIVNEVTPVDDSVVEPDNLRAFIDTNKINVVVDMTWSHAHAEKILFGSFKAAITRQQALTKEGSTGPKLGFIFLSTTRVHGSPSTPVNDLAPVGSTLSQDSPASFAMWFPAHEQAILAARDQLNVAILRPDVIYGRGSWMGRAWWLGLVQSIEANSANPVQSPAAITAGTGVVHVDDMAAALHAAIDRIDGRLGSWPVFDVVAETLSVAQILETIKGLFGVAIRMESHGTPENPHTEILGRVGRPDSSRARIVLEWTPKRMQFLENLPVYLRAWKATIEYQKRNMPGRT